MTGTTRRWREIPTEQIDLQDPTHLADWPRRAEVIPRFAERVEKARQMGRWPGRPIRLRREQERYLLVSGFARLAIAVEAGLETVRAVVEPAAQTVLLAEVYLRRWQENARLNPQKLAQRLEQARRRGTLPVPLRVRPAWPEEIARAGRPVSYTLLDGLYWYRAAQHLGLTQVPAIVQD